MPAKQQPKNEKTKVPGVYRRGNRYVYCYRVEGRQRWGSAATMDEARRLKRQAEADADRGELVDVSDATFGEYARDWIEHYRGRTSRGFRESTRTSYRMQLDTRLIPYFDGVRRLTHAATMFLWATTSETLSTCGRPSPTCGTSSARLTRERPRAG